MKRSAIGYRFVQVLVMASAVCAAVPGLADDNTSAIDDPTPAQPVLTTTPLPDDGNPSITLKGLIWRAKPGIVFLKTPIGMLSLSSKTTLKDVVASQEVTFWVHDQSLAVDIRKRKDGSLVHRYLSGPFKRSEGGEHRLLRWTPEGERTFEFGAYERSLASFREGDLVTVEVDETGALLGLHDLQFDLQIGHAATEGSTAHLSLTGTITKLKSNFIFFRTPIGVVNVNTKIGIKDAQVGQTLALHINGRNVVADLVPPNSPSATRRFVTGPLEYTSPDRTTVKFWTPEGEQLYAADLGKTVLAGLREGIPVTVELNGMGNVVQFHRLN